MTAISTVLKQFCRHCGEATPTALCRRSGPPYTCCARHCCPPGYEEAEACGCY